MKPKKKTASTGGRARPKSDSRRSSKRVKSITAGPLLPKDFADFLKLLNSNRVEYLLVGGYAVCYHGYYRSTGDIDLWIAVNSANAERAVIALRQFGFDQPGLSSRLFLNEGRMIRMGVEPFRLEILTAISGCEFKGCYSRRLTAEIDGILVDIISLPDLKTNKKASGRHKDLADLENLP